MRVQFEVSATEMSGALPLIAMGNCLLKVTVEVVDGYNSMLESQGGVCAICGCANENGRRLYIDHDHANGTVRGLLCLRCNSALGHARDDVSILRKMIEYLEKNDAPLLRITVEVVEG